MPEMTLEELTVKVNALEEVYSQIVVTLVDMTATLNVLLEFNLDDATEEEQKEFAKKVNDLKIESAQYLKQEIDNAVSQAEN